MTDPKAMTDPRAEAEAALMRLFFDAGTIPANVGRAAYRAGIVAELRVFGCQRWSDTEYTCLARLGRGETLFGNDMCVRCRRIAELDASG